LLTEAHEEIIAKTLKFEIPHPTHVSCDFLLEFTITTYAERQTFLVEFVCQTCPEPRLHKLGGGSGTGDNISE
jgi:hypothetical protein